MPAFVNNDVLVKCGPETVLEEAVCRVRVRNAITIILYFNNIIRRGVLEVIIVDYMAGVICFGILSR